MTNNVDWDFIEEHEGKRILNGYIPQSHGQIIGNSGVTIGSGIDLGQTSIEQLQEMGISSSLISKLQPYLGLHKQDALDALNDQPLTISEDECDELMNGEENMRFSAISRLYDNYSDVQFGTLTQAQQTVVMDVAYQYGNGLAGSCPHFWNAVTTQNWPQTIQILRNFGDAYSTRRNAEADLLENS